MPLKISIFLIPCSIREFVCKICQKHSDLHREVYEKKGKSSKRLSEMSKQKLCGNRVELRSALHGFLHTVEIKTSKCFQVI